VHISSSEIVIIKRTKNIISDDQIITMNNLITKKQLQEMLDISKTTVFNWQNKGWLIPISIGAKVYYKRTDVNALIESAYEGNGGTHNG
jgi:hypothetical protein